MNEQPHQPLWYWGATLLLVVAGVASLWSPGQGAVRAIRMPPGLLGSGPTMEELSDGFRLFREEVAQLTSEEQAEVWQSLTRRSESISEQTLYAFFGLKPGEQQELLDRTIDRIEQRYQMLQAAGGYYGDGSRGWIREVAGEDYSRPFSEMTLDERLSLRRDMWEDATPHAFAMRSEFRRLMNLRRVERGLPELYRRWGS
jgi:hypothetical protein